MWQHKRRRKGERRPYRARHTALHSCSRKQFSNFYNLLSPTIISELWPNKSTVKTRFWNTFAVDRTFLHRWTWFWDTKNLLPKTLLFLKEYGIFPQFLLFLGYFFIINIGLKFYFGFGIFPSQRESTIFQNLVFTEHLLLQVFLF